MIADCETCERKQVPCKSCQESQRAICYRCDGDVSDPYCELENENELRSNKLVRALDDIRGMLVRAKARYLVRG